MLSLAAEFAVSGGQCSRTAEKLEGTASAEPNLSANCEIGKSASRETTASGEWRLANGE
jgi:hypothetical protein